jgi:single-stranded-DNA-specific exonuclease
MNNKKRQQVEQEIYEAARQLVEDEGHANRKVLVLAGEGWHEGVLGIVASRLSDAHGKPAVLLSLDGTGQAKGSGRSLPGFNLVEALQDAAALLERFGGHELAAGLTLKEENVPLLREALNTWLTVWRGSSLGQGSLWMPA